MLPKQPGNDEKRHIEVIVITKFQSYVSEEVYGMVRWPPAVKLTRHQHLVPTSLHSSSEELSTTPKAHKRLTIVPKALIHL